MEDFGEIIYIIILIAISLIGSLKKGFEKRRKARKQNSRTIAQTVPEHPDMETLVIIEEDIKLQQEIAEQKAREDSILIEKLRLARMEEEQLKKNRQKTTSINHKTKAETKTDNKNNGKTNTIPDLTDPEEIRKAIISKEILTPKFL